MWSKIKALPIWATLGLIGGAILFAMAASRAKGLTARAHRKEDAATHKLNSGISKELDAGKKLMDSANTDKDKAIVARDNVKRHLEHMGDANEDLDAIADRFNSRRVRHDAEG